MKALALTLRRVRTAVRSDVNTGSLRKFQPRPMAAYPCNDGSAITGAGSYGGSVNPTPVVGGGGGTGGV